MKKLILAAALLYSSTSIAEVTLKWELLPPLDITEWVATCGPTSNPHSNSVSYFHDSQLFEHTMYNLSDGSYTCRAKVLSNDDIYPVIESEPYAFVAKNGNRVGVQPIFPNLIVE